MRQSRLQLLRSYLFFGGIVLIGLILVYTGRLVQKTEREAQAVSLLFAQFAANTASTVSDQGPAVREVYRDVINQINFPLILTDRSGKPRVWRHVGVDIDEVTDFEIGSLDLENPPTSGALARLLGKIDELDSQNDPIKIQLAGRPQEFGFVHYGISPLVRELQLFPLVELSIVAIFLFLAVMGYKSVKDSEQRNVWVGMAKETAHQLGTPISSLMGWIEVMREHMEERTPAEPRAGEGPSAEAAPVPVDPAFVNDVIREMDNDAARLEKIAARFSNVGSVPKLQLQDVVPVVAEATHYLLRRLPHMGSKVTIREEMDVVPPININRELMEWVVENLLKNALDSVDREAGEIEVSVRRNPHHETVDIRIADNGRGMSAAEQSRVFEPGYTTKRRGWGLGLSLAHRIVHEYHGGRIFVEKSEPGQGTTFVIRFPV